MKGGVGVTNTSEPNSVRPPIGCRKVDTLNGRIITLAILLFAAFGLWPFAASLPLVGEILSSLSASQQRVLLLGFSGLMLGLSGAIHVSRLALAAFKRR